METDNKIPQAGATNGADPVIPSAPAAPESAAPSAPEKKESKKDSFTKKEVQDLIAAAIRGLKEESAPKVAKRAKVHNAKMYRFDNKWVMDFKDRNIDPYSKSIIHAFNKFNEQKREDEAWIELVFDDSSTKEVPLTAYLQNRVAVECEIVKHEAKDVSYSLGSVERTKTEGYRMMGTGVQVDQLVEMYENFYTLKMPDGKEVELPEYILA